MIGTAAISDDGRYRYHLSREWIGPERTCVFVMLNPSTADADAPDPTITRCVGFAQREECNRLVVVNLYAFRTPKPAELRRVLDPTGSENDAYLRHAAREADLLIAAWGATTLAHGRAREVVEMLRASVPVQCLGTTAKGHPCHPLYLRSDTALEPYAM